LVGEKDLVGMVEIFMISRIIHLVENLPLYFVNNYSIENEFKTEAEIWFSRVWGLSGRVSNDFLPINLRINELFL